METKISISALLSDYPNSILNDEFASFVLAWIEKSGKTTLEDISKDTGISEHIVVEITLKLYQNNLIEFGNNFIKITQKGKQLIDRFNLSNDIIEEAVGRFNFIQEDAETCRMFLFHYRDNYFENYLNVLSSIKIWNSLLSSNKEEDDNIDKEKFEKEGFISLMLSYFYGSLDFVAFDSEENSVIKKVELPSLRVKYNIKKSNEIDIKPLSSIFKRAFKRLDVIRQIDSFSSYKQKILIFEKEEQLLHKYLICKDVIPQKDWEYKWFNYKIKAEKPTIAFKLIFESCVNQIIERRGIPKQSLYFGGIGWDRKIGSENLTIILKAYSILHGQNLESLSKNLQLDKTKTSELVGQISKSIEEILLEIKP